MKSWEQYKEQLVHDPTKGDRTYQQLIHPTGSTPEYETSGLEQIRILTELIPNIHSLKVLEYGCGDARIIRHATNFYGVDLLKEFVEKAREHNQNCYTLPDLPETNFDIVFAWAVFIHLGDSATNMALKYIYDRLSPGGMAYLQIPVYEVHKVPKDFMDVRTWSETTYLRLLDRIGFEDVETHVCKGAFDYTNISPSHNLLQVLKKPSLPETQDDPLVQGMLSQIDMSNWAK